MDTFTGTGTGAIQVVPYGSKGARALVFPSGMTVILTSAADCDEVIKAAVAAKLDLPVDHWPALYGPFLGGNPDGAA